MDVNRLLYVSHMIGKLSANQIADVDQLHAHEIRFQLQYASAACEQSNYLVALKQLKYSHNVSLTVIGRLLPVLYNFWSIVVVETKNVFKWLNVIAMKKTICCLLLY